MQTLRHLTDEEKKEFTEKLLTAIERDPRAFEMASKIVNYWQDRGKNNRTCPRDNSTPLNEIP